MFGCTVYLLHGVIIIVIIMLKLTKYQTK